MTNTEFVNELSKLRPNSTFLSIMGYRNSYSEIANYSIIFNMSYTNALKRSIAILENITLLTGDVELRAREELLTSYRKSLSNPQKVEERASAYTYYMDDDNILIKGIKLHTTTKTLHLYGLVNTKRILMPGIYPKTNSKPLTIAKQKLMSLVPAGKFRQFKILPSQVDSISVENLSLLPPE